MTALVSPATSGGYRHAALFYSGLEDFVARTVPFIREGGQLGQPTLVVVSRAKIDALRDALGADADQVEFADMEDVGDNPARIIPVWQEFVAVYEGHSLRGVGEPIYAERGTAQLAECQHHERLLNPALADADLFLVCPYDTELLAPEVIAEAHRSHPLVRDAELWEGSSSFDYEAIADGLFGEPLPDAPDTFEERWFDQGALPQVRTMLRRYARGAGLDRDRTDKLVLAVGELVTNSVRHGGGHGILRIWHDEHWLVCEVRDGGRIDDPLIDRRRPLQDNLGGWGLWIANQAADLVQLRAMAGGTVVRLHMHLG